MTDYEKQQLINIQRMQMHSDNPYLDDYYYMVRDWQRLASVQQDRGFLSPPPLFSFPLSLYSPSPPQTHALTLIYTDQWHRGGQYEPAESGETGPAGIARWRNRHHFTCVQSLRYSVRVRIGWHGMVFFFVCLFCVEDIDVYSLELHNFNFCS